MRSKEKEIVKKLSVVIIISVVTFTILSIPLISIIAPLGNIIFPGNGIWRVPGEVPEYETIYFKNLTDNVYVYRDEWGVPHVYAKNENDMSFALGYVHAQDRIFQMDMARRQIRGKLSEVVGELALESDKFNLAMGMEYWAEKTLEDLIEKSENDELDYLDSFYYYVDGVNHYINTHKYEYPIEYGILGFKPTKWGLLDSLCFSKYMSKMLTWEYEDLYNLVNFEALEELGTGKYDELFSLFQPYQIPIVPDYGIYNDSKNLLNAVGGGPKPSRAVIDTVSNFLSNVEKIESEKYLIELRKNEIIGSNNWVVDGVKSSTGKPILCNDMHLAWNLPGIWYEAHLIAEKEKLHTYGFTLAGVPIPIVGHNEYVGWGLTNTGYDVMDWYLYEEKDDDHYILNGVEKEYKKRTYHIKVKGKKPVEFIVKKTVHGPVLNDFLDEDILDPYDDDIVLATQWTGNQITEELQALYGFNHAENRVDFNESSTHFQNPAQNIVYADIDGNIAIRPTGKVPIRKNSNGTFPHDASNNDDGDWINYIDILDLPHSENPAQHYLASANQIVAGPDWNYSKYFLQNSYASGYRARRINELLNNSEDGTVGIEKMKEIQLDVKSSAAKAFTPYLINATEDYADKTSIMEEILTHLKNWNYKMDKDLAAPTIYRKWRDLMMDYTFDDEWDEYGAISKPQLNVLEKLMKNETSEWFDDISTGKVEDRDDIVIKALEDAIDFLEDYYDSDDVYTWRWGDIHKLIFEHISGSSFSTLGKGPFEGDGEGYTVNPSWVDISEGEGRAYGGASERLIVDFSDIKNSLSVIPSGQRGLSNSKHYSDQLEELFLQGKYHRQYFYEDRDDFPKDHIESTIVFTPTAKFPIINIIITIFLISGFIAGIVILKKKGYKKKIEPPENLKENKITKEGD